MKSFYNVLINSVKKYILLPDKTLFKYEKKHGKSDLTKIMMLIKICLGSDILGIILYFQYELNHDKIVHRLYKELFQNNFWKIDTCNPFYGRNDLDYINIKMIPEAIWIHILIDNMGILSKKYMTRGSYEKDDTQSTTSIYIQKDLLKFFKNIAIKSKKGANNDDSCNSKDYVFWFRRKQNDENYYGKKLTLIKKFYDKNPNIEYHYQLDKINSDDYADYEFTYGSIIPKKVIIDFLKIIVRLNANNKCTTNSIATEFLNFEYV